MQVRPDPKLAGELEAAETARLEAARSAMSTEELEAAVRETEELRRRQARLPEKSRRRTEVAARGCHLHVLFMISGTNAQGGKAEG